MGMLPPSRIRATSCPGKALRKARWAASPHTECGSQTYGSPLCPHWISKVTPSGHSRRRCRSTASSTRAGSCAGTKRKVSFAKAVRGITVLVPSP